MTNASELLIHLRLTPLLKVTWGTRPTLDAPGVYLVSLPECSPAERAVIDPDAIDELLNVRPELMVDGARPTPEQLDQRLSSLWIPNQPVVYIGLATSSVRERLQQFYRTKIGANGPHAGGWPIKMLADLENLEIHISPALDPIRAEVALVEAFCAGIDPALLTNHPDPTMPLPFANLTMPKGRRKAHGISGAKAPKTKAGQRMATSGPAASGSQPQTAGAVFDPPNSTEIGTRTQRVTLSDLSRGQIRIRAESKHHFPNERTLVNVALRGVAVPAARWDPRYGPNRERSGVLGIPKDLLLSKVLPDEVLSVTTTNGQVQIL